MGELVILGISAVFTVAGVYLLKKGNHLRAVGKIANAVVYRNNPSSTWQGSDHQTTYNPVVRFLTEKQEWITQEVKTIATNPPMKEGTKLEVIYDPDEPTNVEINSTFRLKILPWSLIVMGACGLVFVASELFDFTQFVND